MNLAAGRIASLVLAMGLTFTASGASAQDAGLCGPGTTSDTLGAMFCQVHASTLAQGIALLLALCFIGGLFLFVRAAKKLIEMTDSRGQSANIGSALLPMAAGSFLIALPATIAIGLGTLVGGNDVWGLHNQAEVRDGGVLDADNVLGMIGNFGINAAGPLATLVMGIAVLIGIALVASAVFGFAKMSDPGQQAESPMAIGTRFVVGIILVNIFWLMEMIGATLGLQNVTSDGVLVNISGMSYDKAVAAMAIEDDVAARFNHIVDIAFYALIPFGLIALVRGLLILKDSADQRKQQASLGTGLTHIIGGVALVNAKEVSCAVMKTLAGSAGFCPGT